MDLGELIAQELGLSDFVVENEVRLAPGVVADFVIRSDDRVFVVEVKGQPAKVEDLAKLLLCRELMTRRHGGAKNVGVLVVPGAGPKALELASATGLRLIRLPPSLLPVETEATGKVPLTTTQSWAVVVEIMKREEVPSIRRLGQWAHVSPGWVSKVVQELRTRRIVRQSVSEIRLVDSMALLDAVAVERPLKSLETRRIETGLDDPGDLVITLELGSKEISGGRPERSFLVAGTTAASEYTRASVHHDRFDVYCAEPEGIAQVFDGRIGGVPIVVHRPDRNIRKGTTMTGGLQTVSPEQALLDVAGTGLAFRDLTLQMVEVVRR